MYAFPEQFAKYQPYEKEPRYADALIKENAQLFLNRYQNSVYYADYLVEQAVARVKELKLLDRTMIIVTGDHGEEFHERGYMGHTSAFDPEQIHVPLVIYVPGREPKLYSRLTEHQDLPATILSLLGDSTPPEVYSSGQSLFSPQPHQFLLSCGWDQCSIVDDAGCFIFGTETYNTAHTEIPRSRLPADGGFGAKKR